MAFIEGWLIFNQPNTRTFFTTGPTPYQLLFPGTFYALKDSSTDNLVSLMENNRELWLLGERTAEVWYNNGGTNFSFARIPGVGPQVGCSATYSLTRAGTHLVWLGRNEQGENIIIASNGYGWDRISQHGVEYALANMTVISDAIFYAYEEGGNNFLMCLFPTADQTWCYDFTSKMWHQRASYNPTTGQFHRHRSNCFMDFSNVRLIGDFSSGNLYQMSRSFYTDAGQPIRRVRRTPHNWLNSTRERVFFSSLQVEFTPGVGLNGNVQGSNPQAMLRWSDDGGFSWSSEHWTSIGLVGNTRNRAIWRNLGHARDRIWEINFTDPVPCDVIGATIFAEASGAGSG